MSLDSNAFRYGIAPAMLLNQHNMVVAVNASMRELLGLDVGGLIDHSVERLTERLGEGLEGSIMPASDGENSTDKLSTPLTKIESSVWKVQTEIYGEVSLRSRQIPCFDSATGQRTGSLLEMEILDLDQDSAFKQALAERFEHQLMWELYAISYDRIQLLLPFYLEVRDRHLRSMCELDSGRILDVGAGTGNVTLPLLNQGFAVTAVDICHPMLDRLVDKISGDCRDRLTVIEDTAEHLPHVADGEFDGVTAMLAFFDMDKPRDALAEAVRVLRSGGTFIATEPKESFDVNELMNHATSALKEQGKFDELEEDWRRIENAAPYINDRIHRSEASTASRTCPPWSAERLVAMLRDYGFEQVSVTDSHFGNCATVHCRKP